MMTHCNLNNTAFYPVILFVLLITKYKRGVTAHSARIRIIQRAYWHTIWSNAMVHWLSFDDNHQDPFSPLQRVYLDGWHIEVQIHQLLGVGTHSDALHQPQGLAVGTLALF